MDLKFYTNTFMDSDRIESDRKGNTTSGHYPALWLTCPMLSGGLELAALTALQQNETPDAHRWSAYRLN